MLAIARVLCGCGILKAVKDIGQPIRTQKAAEMRCYIFIQVWSGWHGSRVRSDQSHEVCHWEMIEVMGLMAMGYFGLKGLQGIQEGLYHISQYQYYYFRNWV